MGQAVSTAPVLTDKIQRARLDCFMFFFTVSFGWGKFRKDKTANGKFKPTIIELPPVCGMRALGYPSRNAVWRAVRRVRETCPELVELYRSEFVVYKEAARRFNASLTEEGWFEYTRHKEYEEWNEKAGRLHRKMGLCYRTTLDRRRVNGDNVFVCGFYRYRFDELLSRKFENKRAHREMRESTKLLEDIKQRIFTKMKVPAYFRRLSFERLKNENPIRRYSNSKPG